jgi:hypothetical protein
MLAGSAPASTSGTAFLKPAPSQQPTRFCSKSEDFARTDIPRAMLTGRNSA